MEELEYKGDKIVKYGENDYIGYYLNADDEVNCVQGKTFEEVCSRLDTYNEIVRQTKKELGE